MNNLRNLRIQKNLSLRQLSKIVGITHATLQLLESGKRKFNEDHLYKLCDYFQCSTDRMLGYIKNKPVTVCDKLTIYQAGDYIIHQVPSNEEFRLTVAVNDLVSILREIKEKHCVFYTVNVSPDYKFCSSIDLRKDYSK